MSLARHFAPDRRVDWRKDRVALRLHVDLCNFKPIGERHGLVVEIGATDDRDRIGAAAQRVLTRNHGHRYYAWQLTDGQFCFEEHPVNLPREKKYEGKYLIQTDQTDMTPQEGVAHYKELNEVERGFRSLKDPIGMRPIWHTNERRVRGHIFVAALAFLIERMLERALKDAKVPLSAQDALTALQTIRHVRFQVDTEERTGVTPGSARARQVLKALKITELRPPTPAEGPRTTM